MGFLCLPILRQPIGKTALQGLAEANREEIVKPFLRNGTQIQVQPVDFQIVFPGIIAGEEPVGHVGDMDPEKRFPIRIEASGELFILHDEVERYVFDPYDRLPSQ